MMNQPAAKMTAAPMSIAGRDVAEDDEAENNRPEQEHGLKWRYRSMRKHSSRAVFLS
jgi:hypothetical protein